jgi:hypothetical protein
LASRPTPGARAARPPVLETVLWIVVRAGNVFVNHTGIDAAARQQIRFNDNVFERLSDDAHLADFSRRRKRGR